MGNENIEKIVTFHFVSGKTLDVKYSQEKFDEHMQFLKENWRDVNSIADTFGINFSLVTHYVVEKV